MPHRDRVQPRALAPAERAAILAAPHAERFADTAPAEVWVTLLDEGTCLRRMAWADWCPPVPVRSRESFRA